MNVSPPAHGAGGLVMEDTPERVRAVLMEAWDEVELALICSACGRFLRKPHLIAGCGHIVCCDCAASAFSQTPCRCPDCSGETQEMRRCLPLERLTDRLFWEVPLSQLVRRTLQTVTQDELMVLSSRSASVLPHSTRGAEVAGVGTATAAGAGGGVGGTIFSSASQPQMQMQLSQGGGGVGVPPPAFLGSSGLSQAFQQPGGAPAVASHHMRSGSGGRRQEQMSLPDSGGSRKNFSFPTPPPPPSSSTQTHTREGAGVNGVSGGEGPSSGSLMLEVERGTSLRVNPTTQSSRESAGFSDNQKISSTGHPRQFQGQGQMQAQAQAGSSVSSQRPSHSTPYTNTNTHTDSSVGIGGTNESADPRMHPSAFPQSSGGGQPYPHQPSVAAAGGAGRVGLPQQNVPIMPPHRFAPVANSHTGGGGGGARAPVSVSLSANSQQAQQTPQAAQSHAPPPPHDPTTVMPAVLIPAQQGGGVEAGPEAAGGGGVPASSATPMTVMQMQASKMPQAGSADAGQGGLSSSQQPNPAGHPASWGFAPGPGGVTMQQRVQAGQWTMIRNTARISRDAGPPGTNLFLCRLPEWADEIDVHGVASQFGKVRGCRVLRHGTGVSKNSAHLSFLHPREAFLAMEKLDGCRMTMQIEDRRRAIPGLVNKVEGRLIKADVRRNDLEAMLLHLTPEERERLVKGHDPGAGSAPPGGVGGMGDLAWGVNQAPAAPAPAPTLSWVV